jgi:hypothetical protein
LPTVTAEALVEIQLPERWQVLAVQFRTESLDTVRPVIGWIVSDPRIEKIANPLPIRRVYPVQKLKVTLATVHRCGIYTPPLVK